MLLKKEGEPAYLEDWPLHYYEIEDIDQRGACLQEMLSRNPDSKEEQERLELYRRRFGKLVSGKHADAFMHGWVMIKVADPSHRLVFSRGHAEKEFRESLAELCVLDWPRTAQLDAEWRDFARTWVLACSGSASYKSAIFGILQSSDHTVALRMAAEIDQVTRIIPAQFGLEQECAQLHEIMKEVYVSLVAHGGEYWQEYSASKSASR